MRLNKTLVEYLPAQDHSRYNCLNVSNIVIECLPSLVRWYVLNHIQYPLQLLTSPVQSNPTHIFANDVAKFNDEHARFSEFVGSIVVGDSVKSTLGPVPAAWDVWGGGDERGEREEGEGAEMAR